MKPKTYGMKEATVAGISRLVREAEEEGFIVLRRNGSDVALVMPLTNRGRERMVAMVRQAMADDPAKLKDNPDLAAAARSWVAVMDQASVKERATVETDPRASRKGR